ASSFQSCHIFRGRSCRSFYERSGHCRVSTTASHLALPARSLHAAGDADAQESSWWPRRHQSSISQPSSGRSMTELLRVSMMKVFAVVTLLAAIHVHYLAAPVSSFFG